MTVGGSSLVTMSLDDGTDKGQRLAYLQVYKDTPPQPGGFGEGLLNLSFYELWNDSEWERLPIGDESAFSALCRGLRVGEVKLRKIVKSPMGFMRARRYDLRLAEIDPSWNDTISVAGHSIPKHLMISYTRSWPER